MVAAVKLMLAEIAKVDQFSFYIRINELALMPVLWPRHDRCRDVADLLHAECMIRGPWNALQGVVGQWWRRHLRSCR